MRTKPGPSFLPVSKQVLNESGLTPFVHRPDVRALDDSDDDDNDLVQVTKKYFFLQ
jgi:hypothetical protein